MDLKEIMDGYLTSDDPNGKGELAEKFVESLRGYEIIIYGAGAVGTSVLSALRMNGMEPLFFCGPPIQRVSLYRRNQSGAAGEAGPGAI